MAYVRVALDTIQPGKTAELLTRIREGLLPLLRQQPGFVAYDVITTGADTAVFIHTCDTQAQAEAAMQNAAAWVREHVAGLIVSVDRHLVGELAVTSRAGPPGAEPPRVK
jgi:hypothetical protein